MSGVMKKNLIILFLFFGYSCCNAQYDVDDVRIQGDSTLMGMKIESSFFSDGAFLIETTGARFEYVKGELKLYQGLDNNNRRFLSTIIFENEPNFIKVESLDDHIIFWSKDLNIGIYGDSTVIISPKKSQDLKCKGNFKPDYEGRYKGELLLIDDKGGMEIYPQRYEAGYKIKTIELGKVEWVADYELNAKERVMIAAFPGKKFNWEDSFNTRIVVTHGAMGLGEGNIYGEMPPNSTIENWAQNFDVLVLFYKGLYERPEKDIKNLRSHGPYIIENIPEFRRLITTAHNVDLKVVTYVGFFEYYRKFHNAEPFLEQIKKLKQQYGIDGVYIDGLSFDHNQNLDSNKILNWEIVRRIRSLFGSEGVIILHGTHGGLAVETAPNIDAYCSATLNGEGVPFQTVEDDYIKYNVRKYGISNTIGLWRPDGKHPQTITYKEIIDTILKMNCREATYAHVPLDKAPVGKYKWGNGISSAYSYYLRRLKHLEDLYHSGKVR